MANQFRYVIVGGGPAGASAVEGIRLRDHSGSIALISKEDRLPYDRPALSKGLWLGKTTLSEISLHDEMYYRSLGAHLFLGTEVSEIEPRKKQLADRAGTHYTYEKLLLATGGTPRMLSFGQGVVQYFRTVDDYLALKDSSNHHEQFLIIGGGFIGAELAAALTVNKKHVTLLFLDRHILQKVLPPDLAAFVTTYYREKGVTVEAEDVPVKIDRAGGVVTVTTKSGKKYEGEAVVGAIGLNLHTEMARRAGLKVDMGVVVNSYLQSSDPNIYAAGDIALFPSKALDKNIRLEHWNNAETQGKLAGENMAGANVPYENVPYFWSDLFDLGFEAIGELDARLQTYADWKKQFREGVVYYLDKGRVVGVLLWNVWEKVDAARELIVRRKSFPHPEVLKGRI